MTEASFASLSPTLLARKGGAKPAMRPQLAPIPDASQANLEDLGWNDMGQDEPAAKSADVVHLTPPDAKAATAPAVLKQQRALADRVTQDNAPEEKPAKRRRAVDQGKRAAFTLRLNAERHLKLRLAATMNNCSAQQLVTDALDALLEEIDDLDALAAKLTRQ
ncbi:hypothetical protein SAMN06297468_0733 [Altererythrobacter xiamenensis]|uniref:Uncharacterized protein n=1 Tax=Altererythrobacter xiamenensis TaxID=1316679 RepID=A0A1Y6ER37_9SPHN|nr:hypothetical protein [Altererythrobacter xiamenensis]SMQ62653.1 hypothetical protein SAMN06297468_0733 [Altererythrobacter xiamenensis]